MKIAGIYPQKIDIDNKTQNMYGEPIGLENILAVAEELGCETDLFVPFGRGGTMSERQFVEKILLFNPDIALLSLYTSQYNSGVRIARELKNKKPSIRIIAGNRHPTFLATKQNPVLDEMFDVFVIGEGESTFRELIRNMETIFTQKNLRQIKGIVFSDDNGNGNVIRTENRDLIKNLDELPDPKRNRLLMEQHYKGISIPPISKNPRYAIIEYSRGCVGSCKFCDASQLWQKKVRFRSPSRVVDEMKKLKENFGTELFYFMDLNFTFSKKKVLELCDEIKKQNLEVSWYCMSNIVTVDEDLLKAMKDAGCFRISWGVESTNNESLEMMDKSISTNILSKEEAMSVLDMSAALGFVNTIYYIIGFPWEDEEDILEAAALLKDYNAHSLNIGIFTPIPNSVFNDEIDEETLNPNPDLYDRRNLVYKHRTLTSDRIKQLQEQICIEFYNNPAYLERVKKLIRVEPRLEQSFIEYLAHIWSLF